MTPREWLMSLLICHPDHIKQDCGKKARPKLSPARARLAALMCLLADPETLVVNCSQRDLGRHIGLQQGNVSAALRDLLKTGWLTLARERVVGVKGAHHYYRLSRPEDFMEQYVEALNTRVETSATWVDPAAFRASIDKLTKMFAAERQPALTPEAASV